VLYFTKRILGMNKGLALSHMACSVLWPHEFAASVRAQGSPDIVWQTNAHYHVNSVAFSQDSQSVASCGDDKFVKVWRVTDDTLLQTLTMVPQEYVQSVAVSPDNTLILSGGDNGFTRLWRIADGAPVWRAGVDCGPIIWSCEFSPDGVRFASGSSDGVIVGNVDGSGGAFFEYSGDVFSVAFSPDGNLIASASGDWTAKVRRVSDGTLLQNLTEHSNAVFSVDFSPDGALLGTTSGDGTARIWKVADGSVLRILDGGGSYFGRFSADGKLFVTTAPAAIKFWRVSDGTLLRMYDEVDPNPISISSDGKYFAYGRLDGTVVLARMPLVITAISRGSGQTVIQWQGGSGHYQLQQRTNLSSGAWQNVEGPTTSTRATNNLSNANIFYRVQSLPLP